MDINRIKNAKNIIQYAIDNNISAKAASVKSGYKDTYVKNTKRDVIKAYEGGRLEYKDYMGFMDLYATYEESKKSNTQKPQKNSTPQKFDTPNINAGEQTKVTQDGDDLNIEWSYSPNGRYPNGHIKTLDQLLHRCEVDTDVWDIRSHVVNKWDVTAKIDNELVTHENFQVKATLEKNKNASDSKDYLKIFENLIKNYQAPEINYELVNKLSNKNSDENNLLVVTLFDLHVGKLAWAGEVGENYDSKIATERFLNAIENLLTRASGFDIDKILFPIGNDFFNSDNMVSTTTAGTPQDEDLRWMKTWEIGCDLLIKGISMLKAVGVPVDVIPIPGNHDYERTVYLATVLNAWFKDDKQVNVTSGESPKASPRKYYNYGKVLLGLTHGNEERENALPMLMASEKPELWGKTKFREFLLGHFHKKRNVKFSIFDKGQILNEEHSVTVRYLSSLSGTEEWHHRKGYVGSHKAGEALLYNDNNGLIAQLNFNFTNFDKKQ